MQEMGWMLQMLASRQSIYFDWRKYARCAIFSKESFMSPCLFTTSFISYILTSQPMSFTFETCLLNASSSFVLVTICFYGLSQLCLCTCLVSFCILSTEFFFQCFYHKLYVHSIVSYSDYQTKPQIHGYNLSYPASCKTSLKSYPNSSKSIL